MKSFTPVKKVLVYLTLQRIILCCFLLFCTAAMTWSQSLSESSLASAASTVQSTDQLAGITAAVKVEHQALGNIVSVNNNITKPLTVGFSQHPASDDVCDGGNISFSVVATGSGTLFYQWEFSSNGGSTWSNATGAEYSGDITATLTITGATIGMHNFQYRCVVTDDDGSTPSNAATLTVNALPPVQSTNVEQVICAQGSGTINGLLTTDVNYQWQFSADGGSNWTNVIDDTAYSGSTTRVLNITNAPAFLDGTLYRYIVTSTVTGCPATSAIYTLHVHLPVITLHPVNTLACSSSNVAIFTASATSSTGVVNYQWLFNSNVITDNAMFSGTSTSSLTVTGGASGSRFSVRVTDSSGCSVTSNNPLLVLQNPISIIVQPQDDDVCALDNAVFTVSSSGSSPSRRWQTDNGTNGAVWTDIMAGGASATLTVTGVTLAMDGYRYRLKISNSTCGSDTSAEATLNVMRHGTWLGVVDTNWHVDGNWCGGVPDLSIDVLIPNGAPNMPTISDNTGTAMFQSLEIENAAKLTINGGSVHPTAMAGTFDIDGTVAYTALVDQPVFPADHGSLEVGGDGNKILQSDVGVFNNLVLADNAKLVTETNILTMYNGSNPISGTTFAGAATSWIVTGNGSSGAANTGLGGLRIEQVNAADGTVLYPIGPTSTGYNPIEITNIGTIDNFTIAVNDQVIPGGLFASGIDRTWIVSEATPGGSNMAMSMRWDGGVEQSSFDRSISEVIRSDGSDIVENSTTGAAGGADPYVRGASFTTLTLFSVASYIAVLPVKLLSFQAQKTSATAAGLTWKTGAQYIADIYTVEKSTDGVHFSAIGQVPGEAGKVLYQFTDHNLGSGETYYRIKMTGKNGETAYSWIATVNSADITGNHFELRPTVTREGQVQVLMQLQRQESVTLRLTDVLGREQLRQSVQFDKGSFRVPVNVSQLAKGIYYLHIRTGSGETKVMPLVKQ